MLLSRLDMEVIFQALITRVKRIEMLETPVYKPGLSARGLAALPVEVVPA